jgi:hypothetical protein
VDSFVSDMKQTKERVGKKTAMATSQITQRWTPPTPDTIKINVDVAFEKTAEEVLLRLFARNEREYSWEPRPLFIMEGLKQNLRSHGVPRGGGPRKGPACSSCTNSKQLQKCHTQPGGRIEGSLRLDCPRDHRGQGVF